MLLIMMEQRRMPAVAVDSQLIVKTLHGYVDIITVPHQQRRAKNGVNTDSTS